MDDLKFINLNHPDGMEKYRKMYRWEVCGFCEKSYNPKKHFDGVMYKDGIKICRKCVQNNQKREKMTNKKVEMKWHKSNHNGGIEVFGYFLDLALAPKETDKDDNSDS